MKNLQLTTDAKQDLVEIRRFTVKKWGEAQSRKYIDELLQVFRLIAASPSIGKSCPDVGLGISRYPHASHVIYYAILNEGPVVFGVLHKRMVPATHLADRQI